MLLIVAATVPVLLWLISESIPPIDRNALFVIALLGTAAIPLAGAIFRLPLALGTAGLLALTSASSALLYRRHSTRMAAAVWVWAMTMEGLFALVTGAGASMGGATISACAGGCVWLSWRQPRTLLLPRRKSSPRLKSRPNCAPP